jgi:hypothetical protein
MTELVDFKGQRFTIQEAHFKAVIFHTRRTTGGGQMGFRGLPVLDMSVFKRCMGPQTNSGIVAYFRL